MKVKGRVKYPVHMRGEGIWIIPLEMNSHEMLTEIPSETAEFIDERLKKVREYSFQSKKAPPLEVGDELEIMVVGPVYKSTGIYKDSFFGSHNPEHLGAERIKIDDGVGGITEMYNMFRDKTLSKE